jgi:hypothetical protein
MELARNPYCIGIVNSLLHQSKRTFWVEVPSASERRKPIVVGRCIGFHVAPDGKKQTERKGDLQY